MRRARAHPTYAVKQTEIDDMPTKTVTDTSFGAEFVWIRFSENAGTCAPGAASAVPASIAARREARAIGTSLLIACIVPEVDEGLVARVCGFCSAFRLPLRPPRTAAIKLL